MTRKEWDGWMHFMTRHLTTLYGLVLADEQNETTATPPAPPARTVRDPDAPADPRQTPLSDIERMAQAAQRRRAP